ncbi:calcium-binding protein [Brasilonema sp. UFV-L1]|uniref:calcium-binding protein n=1 Tax=Brasilonema sp. UFV-L1 TaxID=2234130 RepID=UPI00145EB3C1|nr:calcium-binding protein [Brasilonema sp. UFV-L1]NMG07563.1 calcium-binding protein [Brasilonema sp. UFV-L1]
MRILFTLAHFFNPSNNGRHGSQRKDSQPRIQALTQCLTNLHRLFGKSQCIIDIAQRLAIPANQSQSSDIDIVICTTQDCHLLEQIQLPSHFYKHHSTKAEPMLLGFECQAVLRDCLDKYDYYCFLEDDLILHDPWFFIKLAFFTDLTENLNLLQPNRYEVSTHHLVHKAYIDGNLAPRVTAKFQNVQDQPEIIGKIMNTPVIFRRTLNPHSGCYFLNSKQMQYWVKQSYFLDRDISFVAPLESAATLGIMRTFRIYKPVPTHANFLEIQHFGTAFLNLIGVQVHFSTI